MIGTGLSCLDILMNGGTCANVLSALSQFGEQVSVLYNVSGYALEKHEIFGALEAALKLSAVCSMKEGAQGAFYDKELFGLLKRRYHMKLEKEMDH